MATTTNYGWTTPDDTALVKDGAAAIRTLGSSVDTTTKNLNPETTLGDIAYRSSTANVKTRLGIGSTGQVLTVSGGVPAWATPTAGAYTSIATGSFSGTSVTISSIPSGYKKIALWHSDMYASGANELHIRINGDTTNTNYVQNTMQQTIGATSASAIKVAAGTSATDGFGYFEIADYTGSHYKLVESMHLYSTTTADGVFRGMGGWNGTGAVTDIELKVFAGSFSGGTYILYGVN